MEKTAAMITVYNKGGRTFHVPDHDATPEEKVKGKVIHLAPGKSAALPEAVAKDLMSYPDIVDLSKMQGQPLVADAAKVKKLEQEIEELKKKNAELKGADTDSETGSKADKDKKTSKGK